MKFAEQMRNYIIVSTAKKIEKSAPPVEKNNTTKLITNSEYWRIFLL